MVAARNTRFFKRLRLFAWALAAIGVSSSPLAAQGLRPVRFVIFSTSMPMSGRTLPAEMTANAKRAVTTEVPLVPVRNATIWGASGKYHHDGHKFAIENAVEISETSFGQQFRMPIGSFFGGRIRLGGFGAVTPMENILQGLPASGSLLALSSSPMGQAGLKAPKDDNRYGLSLTLHRAGNGQGALTARLVRCLDRLLK